MNATELRPVFNLVVSDVLQVSNDVRFFRVVLVERSATPDGRYKVHLRSLDDTATVMLVRGGRETVLVVPRIPSDTALAVRRPLPANSPT